MFVPALSLRRPAYQLRAWRRLARSADACALPVRALKKIAAHRRAVWAAQAATMDPPYLQALKGKFGIMNMGAFQSYKAAYIDTGRFRPVMHIIGFVMSLGYLMEYPHLRRECRTWTSPLHTGSAAPWPAGRAARLRAVAALPPRRHRSRCSTHCRRRACCSRRAHHSLSVLPTARR